MKKNLLALAIFALAFGFMGCDNNANGGNHITGIDWDRYFEDGFRDNRRGSVTIVNTTQHDMLLFTGATRYDDLVGGVRANGERTLNFSTESDYAQGGARLLIAIRQSEVEQFGSLNAKIDDSTMITFREGISSTTSIITTMEGGFQYIVSNMNQQFGLELRGNSPNGPRLVYLSPGETNRIIQTADSYSIMLFPVWVAFNTQTRSIVTYTPADPLASAMVQPAPAGGLVQTLAFPQSETAGNIGFPDDWPLISF